MVKMNIEEKLLTLISDTVKSKYAIDLAPGMVMVEIPKDKANGDYSTNIAMRLTKQLGKKPQEIANELVSELSKDEFIEKVDVAGPGFINFIVNKGELSSVITNVIKQDENYGIIICKRNNQFYLEYCSDSRVISREYKLV